jgi:hypothetical protein
MPAHPDFICVGAQKAGTTWLFDQVKSHPDAWMPPIKELRYFSKVFDPMRQLATRAVTQYDINQSREGKSYFLKVFEAAHRMAMEGLGRRDLERDRMLRNLAFLRRVAAAKGQTDDNIAEYIRIFEPAGHLVTGDVSPAYHRLPEWRIRQIATALPACRFLYFVRDPISRLWSQLNMMVNEGQLSPIMTAKEAELSKFLRGGHVRNTSFQSETILRWRAAIGERFRVFVMDDLVADPVAYRRAVFAYIGLDADRCSIDAAVTSNESAGKMPLMDGHRRILQDYFHNEYAALRTLLPGHSAHWLR